MFCMLPQISTIICFFFLVILVYTLYILHLSHSIICSFFKYVILILYVLFFFPAILFCLYIVWLAIIWFGFCHTWRTIGPPPPLFSMFWGHRNSALFCSRVWPSGEAEMHYRYTNKNGFEINLRRNSSSIFSRCFYVDVWLIHVWLCFFPDQIVCHSQKKRQTLLCCFTLARVWPWSNDSPDSWHVVQYRWKRLVCMLQEFENSGHVYREKLCHCTIVTWVYDILWYCTLVWFPFQSMHTYKTGLK